MIQMAPGKRRVAALIAVSTTLAAAPDVGYTGASRSPAIRYEAGASLNVTVQARIIQTSASVGASLDPPAPRMVPRRTTVSAADGRAIPALVYDFE